MSLLAYILKENVAGVVFLFASVTVFVHDVELELECAESRRHVI